MSNDSEDVPQVSPGDLVNEQVARNMAESANPQEPPPAASLPEKSPVSGPQADVHASVSSSVQAAQLPQAAASTGPIAAPSAPVRQESVNVNQDYFQSPEKSEGIQGQPAPMDLTPLLSAIEKLTETIKELKPTEEKKSSEGPAAETTAKQAEKPAPVEAFDPDSRKRERPRFTAPVDESWKQKHVAESDKKRPEEPEKQRQVYGSWEGPRQAPPTRSPVQPASQPGPAMQQQAPDSSQQTGKFQKEMGQYISTNAQSLQQLLGVIESVTAAVSQQNTTMAQVQAQIAQLTQFSSSTYQRSQKAGYR